MISQRPTILLLALAVSLVSVSVVNGACGPNATGPAPLWSADPAGPNALPDARSQSATGALLTSPGALRRFLPVAVDTIETDTLLTGWSEQLAATDGWGTFAPVLLRFDAPLSSFDANALRFVRLDSAMTPVPARASWRANPGVLEVQPLLPLPADADVALVVTRGLVPERLTRAPELDDALARDETLARLFTSAADAAGVAVDEVATVVTYKTGDPTRELLAGKDLVRDVVPTVAFAADPGARTVEGAGLVATGTFASLDVRDDDGLFDPAVLTGTKAARPVDLEVVLVEPDPSVFPPPWPAVILQHGFGGSNAFVVDNAAPFVQRGMAVIGIDAASHGKRGGVTAFLRLDDPRVARDHLRQTTLDHLQLANLATRGAIDVDGVPGNDLDGTLAYYGHSMGAVLGSTFAMLTDDADVVALNAPGGGLCNVFRSKSLNAALQFLFRPALGIGIDDPAYEDAFPILTAIAQPLFEGADPIAFARADARPRLLLQLDVNDFLVPNNATEDLARAAGVPLVELTSLDEAPLESGSGLDALVKLHNDDYGWPADRNPHNLFDVEAVQDQAAEFVATRGRRLVSPR